ncbi:MAG: nickel pincer cofactor biosynthesis protein LarB [Candidatus Hinthialibacter antarcticus]|nr:nickel pincer cofactor biosynthesis protein LarB [Candidatus Hinthialibacter antarcticus]
MHPERIREVLEQVSQGKASVDEALLHLRDLPYEDLGFANIDHHRALRQGQPEVVFGQNKTTQEILDIVGAIREKQMPVLTTRASEDALAQLQQAYPDGTLHQRARAFTVGDGEMGETVGNVLVICAGTSDLPVAEEAALTARFTGSNVKRLSDVGVAGIHRLLGRIDILREADVIVVAAGMEGALASVVGGLVDCPVIGVPTSVGYGASFGGVSALLTMLNSCSAGVTVVNIDNGFGAGFAASVINKKIHHAAKHAKEPVA